MRLVVVLTVLLFAVLAGSSVNAKLAETEHDRVVAYTAFLESNPLDAQAPAMRAWLVDWEDKSKDVVDIVCADLFKPLLSDSVPYHSELIAQFIFGSAANQISNPEQKGKLIPNQVAGFRSMIKAYASIRRSKPDVHIPHLDELSKQEANGTLEPYLTPLIRTSCKD